MPSEDEHVGYAPGKNPPPDFFLKFSTHKFGRDVMTSANFVKFPSEVSEMQRSKFIAFPLTGLTELTTVFPHVM